MQLRRIKEPPGRRGHTEALVKSVKFPPRLPSVTFCCCLLFPPWSGLLAAPGVPMETLMTLYLNSLALVPFLQGPTG